MYNLTPVLTIGLTRDLLGADVSIQLNVNLKIQPPIITIISM